MQAVGDVERGPAGGLAPGAAALLRGRPALAGRRAAVRAPRVVEASASGRPWHVVERHPRHAAVLAGIDQRHDRGMLQAAHRGTSRRKRAMALRSLATMRAGSVLSATSRPVLVAREVHDAHAAPPQRTQQREAAEPRRWPSRPVRSSARAARAARRPAPDAPRRAPPGRRRPRPRCAGRPAPAGPRASARTAAVRPRQPDRSFDIARIVERNRTSLRRVTGPPRRAPGMLQSLALDRGRATHP